MGLFDLLYVTALVAVVLLPVGWLAGFVWVRGRLLVWRAVVPPVAVAALIGLRLTVWADVEWCGWGEPCDVGGS